MYNLIATHLGHKIRAVKTCPCWIYSGQLMFIVVHKFYGSLFQQGGGLFFIKRGHFIITIFLQNNKLIIKISFLTHQSNTNLLSAFSNELKCMGCTQFTKAEISAPASVSFCAFSGGGSLPLGKIGVVLGRDSSSLELSVSEEPVLSLELCRNC